VSRNRALIEFSYAASEDEEWTTLAVTSREMLAVERAIKGFTANSFFADVSVRGLYQVALVVLRVRGVIERAVTFDQFVEGYDVKFGPAPSEATEGEPGESDEDESDETGSGADPTRPIA
jgi:hypothetical protein